MGCLPYEVLCMQDALARGDLLGTLSSAMFGNRWRNQVLNTSVSGRLVTENLLLWALNFPTPNVVLALVGLLALVRALRKTGPARVMLALTALYLAFAFRYTVADRYAFFIPFYILVSVLIGLGAHEALRRLPRPWLACAVVAAAFMPVGFYAVAPRIAGAAGVDLHTRGDVPYRDDLKFFLTPWKTGCVGPQRFAAEALASVAPGAVIYADLTCAGPLLVTQQEGRLRPDVAIVSSGLHSPGCPPFSATTFPWLLERRPVYVVSRRPGYCPAFLLEGYDLTRAGLLWQVRARLGRGRPCS